MTTKLKKCRNCKKMFQPTYNTTQTVCSLQCSIELSKPLVKKLSDKKWKEDKAVMKEGLKPKRTKENELQEQINKIARLIDYGQKCISCGSTPAKVFGCHFKSVGSSPSIRFNLLNIYCGCFKCNNMEGGNVHGYSEGLIETFGKTHWEYLREGLLKDFPYLGLRKDDFPPLIKKAKEIVKELEKDLIVRDSKGRIEMRNVVNDKLGIYVDKTMK